MFLESVIVHTHTHKKDTNKYTTGDHEVIRWQSLFPSKTNTKVKSLNWEYFKASPFFQTGLLATKNLLPKKVTFYPKYNQSLHAAALNGLLMPCGWDPISFVAQCTPFYIYFICFLISFAYINCYSREYTVWCFIILCHQYYQKPYFLQLEIRK